jgi:hypothetical protein
MAGSYLRTAKKLQTACRKLFGVKLLINQRQWYSDRKKMAMTVYSVTRLDIDSNEKRIHTELFKTYSQVQLVLFMRDYWYQLNGWEVPKDNPVWEAMKDQYAKEHKTTEPLPGEYEEDGGRKSED